MKREEQVAGEVAKTAEKAIKQGKQLTTDAVDYLTDYAHANPGAAALWCLGVGFVLGWKLKPW